MKNKTEIAIKVTDKNREKVRGILEMFGEEYEEVTKNEVNEFKAGWLNNKREIPVLVYDYNRWIGTWLSATTSINKTIVKPKELRNILAIEHLKECDVVVVRGIGYKGCDFVLSLNRLSSSNNDNIHFLSDNYYNLTKSRIGYGSGVSGYFLRYATEEEKGFVRAEEDKTQLVTMFRVVKGNKCIKQFPIKQEISLIKNGWKKLTKQEVIDLLF